MQIVTADYKTAIVGNPRRFKPRVSFWFNGESNSPIVFDDSDYIRTFNGLEEIVKSGDILFNSISSNTINIELLNENKIFTPTNTLSVYYGKLVPGTKVQVELALMVDYEFDIWEYVKIFTGYTAEWTGENTSVVNVTCYDRLYFILEKEIEIDNFIRLHRGITIEDAWDLVFESLDWVKNTDYSIEGASDTIPYFWLEGNYRSIMMQLQNLHEATINVDRDGKVIVKSVNLTLAESQISLNDNNSVIHSHNVVSLMNSFNKIKVKYFTKGIKKEEIRSIDKYETIEFKVPNYPQENLDQIPEFFPHPTHGNGPVEWGKN